jgi:hypothetical protein
MGLRFAPRIIVETGPYKEFKASFRAAQESFTSLANRGSITTTEAAERAVSAIYCAFYLLPRDHKVETAKKDAPVRFMLMKRGQKLEALRARIYDLYCGLEPLLTKETRDSHLAATLRSGLKPRPKLKPLWEMRPHFRDYTIGELLRMEPDTRKRQVTDEEIKKIITG